MVTPAQQLASKIPDIQVQLWAAALLKNLYAPDDPRQRETMHLHNQFDTMLQQDQYQALQMPEHNYIHVSFFLYFFIIEMFFKSFLNLF